MASRKRQALHIGVAFIFVALILANGISLVGAILVPSIWTYIFAFAVIAVDLYFLYVRFYKKKEPQYPMVPPEGKPDVYFPRSKIPRPIFDDARKMQKKKKLAKIDRMRHKKKKQ